MPKVIDDQSVYQAVMEAIATYGYEGATTKQIAEAAGMHEATLFRKYGSKLNLAVAAVEATFSQVPFAHLSYTGELEADLMAIIEAYLATSEQLGVILPILLHEIPQNPELRETLAVPWKNIFRAAEIVERYQSEGRLKAEAPLTTISVLIGPLMVRHMVERAGVEMGLPKVEAAEYVENFLAGRKRPAD